MALPEPRVPKPPRQGDARTRSPKPAIRSGNGQSSAPPGQTKHGKHSTGTSGKGAKNNPPRT